jgi:hypothetical protein
MIISDRTINFSKKKLSIFLICEENNEYSVLLGDNEKAFQFKSSQAGLERQMEICNKLYNVIINFSQRVHLIKFLSTLKLLSGLSAELACLHIVTSCQNLNEYQVHKWLYYLRLGFTVAFDKNKDHIKIIVQNQDEKTVGFFETSILSDVYRFRSEIISLPA